jgi:hypothetical protein
VLWGYLGPRAEAPSPPELEWTHVPAGHTNRRIIDHSRDYTVSYTTCPSRSVWRSVTGPA